MKNFSGKLKTQQTESGALLPAANDPDASRCSREEEGPREQYCFKAGWCKNE